MRALRRLWMRSRNLMGHQHDDARLREEMEQHLQLETEANMQAGMTPAAARRAAGMKFGSVETIREGYRAEQVFPALDKLWQSLTFAFRTLRTSPTFTVVAVLTMALGIGATSAIFSLIQGVLLTPPPYTKPNQLILVSSERNDGKAMTTPRLWAAQQWMEWQASANTLQGVAGYSWTLQLSDSQ